MPYENACPRKGEVSIKTHIRQSSLAVKWVSVDSEELRQAAALMDLEVVP
jgi:hypothetical protein